MSDKTMTVTIRADKSKFTPVMKEIEAAAAAAGGSIQKNFNRAASQGTDKMTASLNNLMKAAAGYMAFGQLKSAFSSIISAAIKDEKVMAILNATWTATGRTADVSTAQIEKQAMAFEKLTGVTHDQYLQSYSVLAIYEQISSEAFPRIMTGISDLAKLMGTDMSGATKQLAFALDDPLTGFTRLQKAGVKFTAQQKEMIKSFAEVGNIAAADNVILTIMEGKLKGVTQNIAATASGTVLKFGASWEYVKESLGKTIIESDAFQGSLTRLTNKFYELADNKELMDKFAKTITGGIETVKNTAETLAPIIGTIGSITKTALDGFNSLPTVIQQFGLVGATMFGWKGLAVLATYTTIRGEIISQYADFQKKITAGTAENREYIKTLTGIDVNPPLQKAGFSGGYKPYDVMNPPIGKELNMMEGFKQPARPPFIPEISPEEKKRLADLKKFNDEYNKLLKEQFMARFQPGKNILGAGYFGKPEIDLKTFGKDVTGFNGKKGIAEIGQFAPGEQYRQAQEAMDTYYTDMENQTAWEIENKQWLQGLEFDWQQNQMARIEEQKDAWVNFGSTISNTMMMAMQSSGNSIMNFRNAFGAMIQSMAAQWAANAAVFALLSAISAPLGFAKAMPSALSFITGGLFKAAGGPVESGRPYIVGERGQELFVPKVAGTIVPGGSVSTDNSRWSLNFYDSGSRQKMIGLPDEQFAEQFKRAVRDGKIQIKRLA